ncbi:hypothetical protein F2P56_032476 [Juglans regia]|uniref:Low-temperature-induced 65 kDa protein-like n=2 Tax=Juglans regia TaxID=51240 RepID=A0A833UA42_JUGRE|nr:uncharacterized protein LOC108989227 [Juglans regia]KAF5446880.1 hypothetical protein F2P56_032476 [Juglans regia]
MAQLDRVLRSYGDKPKSAPSSPTLEHLFRGGESSKWPPTSSPSFGNHLDYEEDHSHHHKKPSVLTKMKERAKKLRHSLSRKKQSEDGNSTPSWGVSLDDDEDLEEDAEYLGAPMYESELAPEGYKETARHHPRSFHVVSEKHVLASSVNRGDEADKENPSSIPNKTITETVTKTLAPTYSTLSDATHTIASKLQGISVTTLAEPQTFAGVASPLVWSAPATAQSKNNAIMSTGDHQIWDKGVSMKEYLKHKFEPGEDERALNSQVTSRGDEAYKENPSSIPNKKITETVTETLAPTYSALLDATHTIASKLQGISVTTLAEPQTFPGVASPRVRSAPASKNNAIMSTGDHQICDKGVSMKEYLKQKFEHGEDERALNSQVTSNAVSPRKSTTPGDIGVVEKVREAVTSLLRNKESSKSTATSSAKDSTLHMPISIHAHSTKSSPAQLPTVSTNLQEAVGEEENRGRILQAN